MTHVAVLGFGDVKRGIQLAELLDPFGWHGLALFLLLA